MPNNLHSHSQPQNNGIFDAVAAAARSHSCGTSSTTQVLTKEQHPQSNISKRCHGNRKLQHFKRKCRARGLTEEQIVKLIESRNNHAPMDDADNTVSFSNKIIKNSIKKKKKKNQSTQHKRCQLAKKKGNHIMKSLSQLSISQVVPKPLRNGHTLMLNISARPSKYLSMPKKLLFHSLSLQCNRAFNKRKEKYFLHTRIRLLDRQFCLNLDLNLYQSYLTHGSHNHLWPDDIIHMAQTDNHKFIERFIQEHLARLQQSLDQCTTELLSQASSSPTTLSLPTIESHLKDFVRLHHVDLTRKVNYCINKFKDTIHEKHLFDQLSSYRFTNEQQQIVHHLISIRQKQLNFFEEMTMFQERIVSRKLPNVINNLDNTMPSDEIVPLKSNNNNAVKSSELTNKQYRKVLQEYKRQYLNQTLEEFESNIEELEYSYQQELLQLEYELCKDFEGTKNFMCNLNDYLNHRTSLTIRDIRYKQAIFRSKLIHPRHRNSTSASHNQIVSVYPEAIIETTDDLFTNKELDFLCSAGGPNYIRLNQSFLYHKKKSLKHTEKELSKIVEQFTTYLYNRHTIPPKSSVIQQLSSHLQRIFYERYTTSLSYLDIYHTRRDMKLMLSIKRKLMNGKHILRVTDKSGVFHIGQTVDYDRKVANYQAQTGAYIQLTSNPLMDTFSKVVHLLNELSTKKQIRQWQYQKMMPVKDKIKLAYLYFVPKPHKEGTPLRPIVSSINAPTTGISKMLDQLIRPLFDQHVEQTTIIDGVDLLRRLEKYVSLGLLKPTTHFCTFDITDLYTMLPQEESIDILKKFLRQFNHTHVQGMTIDAIEHLARIVLTENVFTYNNKYYRQIVGGAMGSPFTLTLANIFMWNWEQQLVEHQRNSNEMYGRYIDDVFLTFNDSSQSLRKLLDEAKKYHPNIKFNYEISSCATFLDVQIKNENGNLITSVHHKQAAEPYVVPFKSDHPRHIFENIIQGALLRAIRYSSNRLAFDHERRNIQLMLLYNGYPVRYIYSQFKKFLTKYSITSTSILPMIHDDNEYYLLRQQQMSQTTISEHVRASRIASQIDFTKTHEINDQLVHSKLLKKQQQQAHTSKPLIVHYTYEKQFSYYKSRIHEEWNKLFHATPVRETRLIVGTRNNPNLIKELVRRSPYFPTTREHQNLIRQQNGNQA